MGWGRAGAQCLQQDPRPRPHAPACGPAACGHGQGAALKAVVPRGADAALPPGESTAAPEVELSLPSSLWRSLAGIATPPFQSQSALQS